MNIFVTGISGTGKTTVSNKLKDKGFSTVDLDDFPDLCSWVNIKTGKKAEASNRGNVDNDFIDNHEYKCDTEKLVQMMDKNDEDILVFGSVGDNSTLIDLFDKVILLQCSPKNVVARLQSRDTNEFGKDPKVQNRMLSWKKVFDGIMIKSGAVSINADNNIDDIVNEIVDIIK
jgi:broad-specificity NMP kinase